MRTLIVDNIFKGVVGLFSVAVTILLAMAIASEAPIDSIIAIADNPFATVFSIELILGILVLATVIFLVESNTTTALIWIVLLFTFGNPVAGVYLIVRYNYLKSLVSSQ